MDVGIVGLGKMGGAMARRLLARGHRVIGLDREPEQVRALVEAGGTGVQSWPDLVERLSTLDISLNLQMDCDYPIR